MKARTDARAAVFWLAVIILIIIIAGSLLFRGGTTVSSVTGAKAWTIADYRILEEAEKIDSAFDLYAAATRLHETDLQIRLEILDGQRSFDYDLYLALDTQPGGVRALPLHAETGLDWDLLLVFAADRAPRVITADGTASPRFFPRISRNPDQDIIVVSINQALFPGDPQRFAFEAFLTSPGSEELADTLGPVRSDAWVTQRAPLLLAYWDSLPSATPAQTLRRWDGAHTGPLGSRNGLRYLLQAAFDHEIPITLMDFKTPERLSATEYIGGMKLVRGLVDKGLLLLPDVQEGDGFEAAGAVSDRMVRKLGFSASPFLYGNPGAGSTTKYRGAFARLTDPNHLVNYRGLKVVPLPADNPVPVVTGAGDIEPELEPSFLSPDIRRKLIHAAISRDPGDIVVLGGSLAQTTWADVSVADPVFAYLANHPWIHPVDADELLSFPVASNPAPLACVDFLCNAGSQASVSGGTGLPAGSSLSKPDLPVVDRLMVDLRSAPPDPLTDLAWRAFAQLTGPTKEPGLDELRKIYLGQIQALLLAGRWSTDPGPIASCHQDADLDGNADCILATENLFAVFQPLGGRLTFAFYRNEDGTQQIIGPASQFSVGISDPSLWDFSMGPVSDPNEIPGAFFEPSDPIHPYQPRISPGSLVFQAENGSRKSFTLLPNGIRFEYEGISPTQFQIPLAVSPHERYQKLWAGHYFSQAGTDGWQWGLKKGVSVNIETNGKLDAVDFMDSIFLIRTPEDPDRDYPAGHYLPYPLALVTVDALDTENRYFVEITIQ